MNLELERLIVSIESDVSKLKQGLSEGQREVSSFDGKVQSLTAKAKAGSVAVAAAVGATAIAIGALVKKGIDGASDLAEVQNVVNVAFGESAGAINAWALTARDAFGLSELQAKQYTGTMGAMFKSMGLGGAQVADMSIGIAGLTGDFASFYNLDHDTAFQKIRSGIAGETEGLKALGINMSTVNLEAYAMTQGITKSFQEMTQAEQAQLRYNYLMSVSADAQGDFTRTSEGFANQQRIMATKIQEAATALGKRLLPAFTTATNYINENVLPAVTNFIDTFKFSEVDPTTITTVAGVIIGALVPAFVSAAASAWALMAPLLPFIAIGAAVGAVIGVIVDKLGGWKATLDIVKTAWGDIVLAFQMGDDLGNSGFLYDVGRLAREAWDAIQAVKTGITDAIQAFKMGDDLGNSGFFYELGRNAREVWDTVSTFFSELWTNLQPLRDTFAQTFATLRDQAQPIMDRFKQVWADLKPILEVVGTILGAVIAVIVAVVIGVVNGLLNAIDGLTRAFAGVIGVISGVFAGIKALFTGDWSGLEAANQKVRDSIKEVWGGLWDAVKGFFSGFVDGVVGFFTGLYDTLVGHSIVPDMVNAIIDWIAKLPDRVLNYIGVMVTRFVAKVVELKNKVVEGFNILVDAAMEILALLPNKVLEIGSRLYNAGKEIVAQLIQGLKDKIVGAVNVIRDFAEDMMRFLPQSPAKEGPLRGLSKVGAGFVGQLEEGFQKVNVKGIMEPLSTAMLLPASATLAMAGGESGTFGPSVVEEHYHFGDITIPVKDLEDIKTVTEFVGMLRRKKRQAGGEG